MRVLNLGILAHVDAGKTSLTERLLYVGGVIDQVGSVDGGNTQTDSLEQERERGITIKAAVASFEMKDIVVNLIDTPGHPDFIAEVERSLSVLDGAVLVISAVEGVQAQTRVLMRALKRLQIPTLIFVNKIDRRGARFESLLSSMRERLSPSLVAMSIPRDLGGASAYVETRDFDDPLAATELMELLAEQDDRILSDYLAGRTTSAAKLRRVLRSQTRSLKLQPVYFGSAITGAGIEQLVDGLAELLPAREGDVDEPPTGTVFKVDRGSNGERIAYARMFAGEIKARQRVAVRGREQKITALSIFHRGEACPSDRLPAGRIGMIWGLTDVRIGDTLGISGPARALHRFSPPTLETVIVPRHPSERGRLNAALTRLAEQDPLINLRQNDERQEMSLSLYGEVQKEVIQETLSKDFGVEVEFRETTTICVERPIGVGEAIDEAPYPFIATVGLRVEPGQVGSGVEFRLEVDVGSVPHAFLKAVEDAVRDTLRQGLHGWEVTDVVVTMTQAIRYRKWATSTAADHRNLTPLVVADALRRAGTRVFEPVHRFQLDAPADTLSLVLPALGALHAVPYPPEIEGSRFVMEGDIPAARVHDLQRQLPGLTHGEGILESAFDHYEQVRGPVPDRPRQDQNPFNRGEYLLRMSSRV